MILVAAVCGAILILAEALYRTGRIDSERTRKLVHVLMGGVACGFPWMLAGTLPVALVCGFFLGGLAWSRARGWLPSVHSVPRTSGGALYYPVAVLTVFVACRHRPAVYVASILVLAVSDAVAALAGQAYGRHAYRVRGETKSLEGSAAFVLSAVVCIHLPLWLLGGVPPQTSLLVAIPVAFVAAVTEGMATRGTDNIVVPVVTCGALSGLVAGPVGGLWGPLVCALALVTLLSLAYAGLVLARLVAPVALAWAGRARGRLLLARPPAPLTLLDRT